MPPKKRNDEESTKKSNNSECEQDMRRDLLLKVEDLTAEIQREFDECSKFVKQQGHFELCWSDEKIKIKMEFSSIQEELKHMKLENQVAIEDLRIKIQENLNLHQGNSSKAKNHFFFDSRDYHNRIVSNLKEVSSDAFDCIDQQRSVESAHFAFILELKKEFYSENLPLQEESKKNHHNATRNSEKNIEFLLEESDERICTETSKVDHDSNIKIAKVLKYHENKSEKQRKFFKQRLQDQLIQIAQLKMFLLHKRKYFLKSEDKWNNAESRNMVLKDPFKATQEAVISLSKKIASATEIKKILSLKENELKTTECIVNNMKLKNEIILQRLELLEQQKKETQEEFNEAILSLKQRQHLIRLKLQQVMDSLQDLTYKVSISVKQ